MDCIGWCRVTEEQALDAAVARVHDVRADTYCTDAMRGWMTTVPIDVVHQIVKAATLPYDAASPSAPHDATSLRNSEDELWALAAAIKPTGKAAGPFTALAMAGMILSRLRENGWDVRRA